MALRPRFYGLGVVALATAALALSCSLEGQPVDDADSSAGSGGGAGTAGTMAGAGTTGSAGTVNTAGAGAMGGGAGTGGVTGTGGMGTGGSSGGTAGSATGGGGSDGGKAGSGAAGGGATGGAGANGGAGAGGGAAGGGAAGSSGTAGSAGTSGPSTGCGTPTTLTSGRASIEANGKMREYIILIPDDYDPTHPYKLIFGWHPWGGSAEQIENGGYFGLENVIDGQAILVAPEGQDYQNNGLGWGNADGEDIMFLHAMIDRFSSDLCIDQDRIFSTGFSFGAMFSFTLACTADSRMRAIAPMAGNATTSGRCEDGTRPVATMAFIGTDDSLLDGHRSAVQIFVERNGCTAQTVAAEPNWCGELASNFLPCSCSAYQGCSAGYPVVECEYTAGHQFAPSAGETLWNFFSQF